MAASASEEATKKTRFTEEQMVHDPAGGRREAGGGQEARRERADHYGWRKQFRLANPPMSNASASWSRKNNRLKRLVADRNLEL
jgi:hypothetical protein